MKLHSPYLNPFQSYPERELAGQVDRPAIENNMSRAVFCSLDGQVERPAIENNMSRAVFCALANADGPSALAVFLQHIAEHAKSPNLQKRIEHLAEALRKTEPAKVEFDLQGWPPACALEEPADRRILIGISSCHVAEWTHNTRSASDNPRADAWIYVPGQMLLVFECKNDDHPLDATQVSDYVYHLGLDTEQDCLPRAKPECYLNSAEEATEVQAKCKDRVLDVHWSAVADALEKIQRDERGGDIGRWLSGQAAAYIRSHMRPPYHGVGTILEWLNGLDTPDRRDHLRNLVRKMGDALDGRTPESRTLVRKMGEALAAAAKEPGAITFTTNDLGKLEVLTGVFSAVYVRLCKDRQPIQRQWFGKMARLNLSMCFCEDESKRIALDFWVEATGAQLDLRAQDKVSAWNDASERHAQYARDFEDAVEAWVCDAPTDSLVDVNAIRFKGTSRIWKGGGKLAPEGPRLSLATPQEALTFIKTNRDVLWCFPQVGSGGELTTIEEAQPLVRKPALALRVALDVRALIECGDDAHKLQTTLKKAVANITGHT